jgi:hypothetical protein
MFQYNNNIMYFFQHKGGMSKILEYVECEL